MVRYFATRLGPLASARLQLKYGVSGTKDKYLLVSEILEGASECVERVRGNHRLADGLNSSARAAILTLGDILVEERQYGLAELPWAEVFVHPVWLRLRTAAEVALNALGTGLPAWEVRELMG